MKGKQRTVVVLVLAVLVCIIISAMENSGLGVSAANGENIEISEGSPVITNKVINSLHITGGAPIIQNSVIISRAVVNGGSPTFVGNVIEDGIHIDAKEGQVTISNNTINSKSGFSNIYVQGIYANISGNIITGNNCQGISVLYEISSASITKNQVHNCTIGILMYGGGTEIIGNLIVNNTVAIKTDANWIPIENNTITENQDGIVCWSRPELHNNNIWNNSHFNFHNAKSGDVDATNNWWGTVNKTLIEDTLTESISFEPFLDSPNLAAPIIPTANPSQQTVPSGFSGFDWLQAAVLAALVVAVSLVYYMRHRKNKPVQPDDETKVY